MRAIFDMENPLMRALSVVADLMILNLLTIACCLPVFTAGAALTALHTTVIQCIRGEETHVARDYLRAFRENFRKGCGMGLLFLGLCLLLGLDYLAAEAVIPMLRPVIAAFGVLALALGQYAFALLARYENTLLGTLKNAALLTVSYFPKTVGMVLFAMVLWVLAIRFLLYGAPILFLCGISLPCYVDILLMQRVFFDLEKPKQ